jgi:hypothetical protein
MVSWCLDAVSSFMNIRFFFGLVEMFFNFQVFVVFPLLFSFFLSKWFVFFDNSLVCFALLYRINVCGGSGYWHVEFGKKQGLVGGQL